MEFDPVALLSILDIPIGDLKVRQLRFPPPLPPSPSPFLSPASLRLTQQPNCHRDNYHYMKH